MCFSCGCCDPSDSHGDSRNITTEDMQSAADWFGGTVKQVVDNIAKTAAGSPPEVAKEASEPITTGTVLKADEENRFLLLVAYSPNKMPQRGADGYIDIVRPEVLEKACWKFMDNGAKVGLWHEDGHADSARVVENYIHRGPDWVLKAPNGQTQTIKAGDWVVGLICSPSTWNLYKSGQIGGASPQGGAERKRASQDLLAKIKE